MIRNSAPLTQSMRIFRIQFIKMITDMSQQYSQYELDTKVHADVLNGEIVGFDLSELVGMPEMRTMCIGNKRVKLGSLDASNWCTMTV